MVATAPGQTEQVTKELDAVKGGSVGQSYDKVGYVRATVPTAKADSAIAAAAKLTSVHAIDLRQDIVLDDPTPDADASKSAKSAASAAKTRTYAAPNKKTPARNPYNPSFETGAVDFVKKNPKADGRGITIGILDSGVDLAHPALQKTTTGERKIVDWVTATDPIIDSDGTWLPMTTAVSGPDFTLGADLDGAGRQLPVQPLHEDPPPTGGDVKGDVNRDGDTNDAWGSCTTRRRHDIGSTLNNNGDFTDEHGDAAVQGQPPGRATSVPTTRRPSVAERHSVRRADPQGRRLDPWRRRSARRPTSSTSASSPASTARTSPASPPATACSAAEMNGAAPGAKIVSSRACDFGRRLHQGALTEGMIDLVVNRDVDVVNMSIGGLPAPQRRHNALASCTTSSSTPTASSWSSRPATRAPAPTPWATPVADKAISVGASISKETWAANYGSQVDEEATRAALLLARPARGRRLHADPRRPGRRDQHHPDLAAGRPGPRGGLLPAGRLLDAAGHLDGLPAGRGRLGAAARPPPGSTGSRSPRRRCVRR